MNIFLAIIIGYLCGSIPTGVWYARLVHGIDIRQVGSGNSGGTNIGRTFGLPAALFVIAIDVLKAWIPLTLSQTFLGLDSLTFIAMGIACVLGHAYPCFAHLKGGKVVATSAGVLAAYNIPITLAFVFLLLTILYFTSTVSLASMTSYTLTAFYILWSSQDWTLGLGFLLIALFLIYRHRENIQRLRAGQESMIAWGHAYHHRNE